MKRTIQLKKEKMTTLIVPMPGYEEDALYTFRHTRSEDERSVRLFLGNIFGERAKPVELTIHPHTSKTELCIKGEFRKRYRVLELIPDKDLEISLSTRGLVSGEQEVILS